MAASRKSAKSQLQFQSIFKSTTAAEDQDNLINLVIEYVADQIDLKKLLSLANKDSDTTIISSLDLEHRKKLKELLNERLSRWYYLSARTAWNESTASANKGFSSAGVTSMLFGWAFPVFAAVTLGDQMLSQVEHRVKVNKRAQDFVELVDKLTPELIEGSVASSVKLPAS